MIDVTIIGGGVVGCNILNYFTRHGLACVLLEKYNDVGTFASKANSGLVHAGFDASFGTLKAKLNVRGNELFEKLAKSLNLPFKRIGALVAGNDLKLLKELNSRGAQNGVKTQIVSGSELRKLEPNLSKEIKYALYAPSAGLISPYMLSIALCEEAILNGAKVFRNCEIKKVEKLENAYKIFTNSIEIQTKIIINAAAAGFNDVSKLLKTEQYPLQFRRGEYYLLDNDCEKLVNHTIFQLPTPTTKGVLVTPTIDGNILVGPTSYESDTTTPTTKEGLNFIREQASLLIPNIPFGKNIRVFAGVRTISGHDFIIEKSKKQTNIINIAGICSPGLSSSPAIAEYVYNLIGYSNKIMPKIIQRQSIPTLKNLTVTEQNKLIKKNSDYGKIICKCETVSLAEIKASLTSPLPALSVDGVKRRVRAGMGQCQGGFCMSKVIEEISKTLNIPMENVLKEHSGSNIICSDIKPEVKNDKM